MLNHLPEPVLEKGDVKIFTIHRVVKATRLNILVVDGISSETLIIDIVFLGISGSRSNNWRE